MAPRHDKFGVNAPHSYSKLQELVPQPTAATGQFGDDDITPVIRLAASHKRNLAISSGDRHGEIPVSYPFGG
jgi:hypothetical protein